MTPQSPSEEEIVRALGMADAHDPMRGLPEVILAAAYRQKCAELQKEREEKDTVPRSRYSVACDQYIEIKTEMERRGVTAKERFVGLEARAQALSDALRECVEAIRDTRSILSDHRHIDMAIRDQGIALYETAEKARSLLQEGA